jgi:hypothetical protein
MKRSKDIDELADAHVACRALGHQWEPVNTFVEKYERRTVWVAEYFCLREENAGLDPTTRWDTIAITGSDRGVIIARQTQYPDGYLLERGATTGRGRYRPTARIELMERLTKNGSK